MDQSSKILENWNAFRGACTRLGTRAEPLGRMLDHFEERAPLAPASSRLEYHAAYPGGLIDHSLRVMRNAIALSKPMGGTKQVPIESLVIASLFHDWGKVGSLEEDLYLPQESSWHRERGMMYVHNENILFMTNVDRTIWLMQHFGVHLSEEEFLGIRLNDGQYVNENKPYGMKEPTLALIVHTADRIACDEEKGRSSLV